MKHGSIRLVAATVLLFSALLLGGCAKSIAVSPQQITLSAAQPSAQVTVTMKWPHTAYWNLYNSDPDGLLVSPVHSQDKVTQVTVTASDLSSARNEKITFYVADADGPEALLEVHVQ